MTYSKLEAESRRSHIDKKITATEEEVQALLKRCQELRRERNGLAPVHRLPDDVLAKVFHLTESSDWTSPAWTAWLIHLTTVCHHWRVLIPDYQMLWANIACKNNRQLEYALERSGNALISLELCSEYSIGDYLDTRTAALIRPHLHRIKNLEVGAKFSSRDSFCTGAFPFFDEGAEFPALRDLESSGMELRCFDISKCSNRLVSFKSCSDSFDWSTHPNLPPSLVNLTIIDPFESIPIPTLIHILGSLPNLTKFKTENCLCSLEGEELMDGLLSDSRPISLPALQRWSANEAVEALLALFSRLSLSPHINIKINAGRIRTPGMQDAILTAIGAAQERNQSWNTMCKFPTELFLAYSGLVLTTFKVSTAKDDDGSNNREQRTSWNIITSPPISLFAMASHWDFSKLTRLEICGFHSWQERARRYEIWLQSFGDLPNLQVLELDQGSTLLLQVYIMEEISQIWCNLDDSLWSDLDGFIPLLLKDWQVPSSIMRFQDATVEDERRLKAEEKARAMGLKFCTLRKLSVAKAWSASTEPEPSPRDFADFLLLRANLGVGIEELEYQVNA